MNILIISNYKQGIGGISGQVEYLQKYLTSEGYKADIFSTKGNPLRRIVLFFALLRKAKHYDALHIHGCSEWGFLPVVYGIVAGKLHHKRTIVTYHGGDAGTYFAKHERFVRRWLNRADKVVVLSGFLKAVFDEHRIPCVVIPNIIELGQTDFRTRTTIEPHFVSVRHLRDLYNIPCILRAFKRVQKVVPQATLDILGQGDLRESLEQWVREKGLQHVTFVGQVPNEKIYDYLNKNDILLSAPRIDNMPVSVIEAFNAGLLVISSRVGGVPYMVDEGRTGLLFPYDDDEAMANHMLWAVEHPAEALAMTQAAKVEVDKYQWRQVKTQLLTLYNV